MGNRLEEPKNTDRLRKPKEQANGQRSQSFPTYCSIIHQNMQSLGNAVELFEKVLLEQRECRWACVTEHWKTLDELSTMGLNGFQLASSYCRKRGSHGGSAIYVKDGISWKSRKQLERISVCKQIEISAIETTLDNKHPAIIAAIYRPSGGNLEIFFEKLEELLTDVVQEWKTIIIAGDFNIEMKDDNNLKDRLFSLIKSFGLCPKSKNTLE